MSTTGDAVTAEDYARAERFLSWNAERLAVNLDLRPNWFDDGDRFWYRATGREGVEFVLVDPATGMRRLALDATRLAAAMATVTGDSDDPAALRYDDLTLLDDGRTVWFDTMDARWTCDLTTYNCSRQEQDAATATYPASPDRRELRSPDGHWAAFAHEHNLYVRDANGAEEQALTHDGKPGYGYAAPVRSPLHTAGLTEFGYQAPVSELFPAAIWSPDSAKLVTHRIDERRTGSLHLVQSSPRDGSTRPVCHAYTYPLPGDEHVPQAELIVVDVARQLQVWLAVPPLNILYYGSPMRRQVAEQSSPWVWWSQDSSHVYVLRHERGYQALALYVADARTGEARLLVEERGETPVGPHVTTAGAPNVRVIADGAGIVWLSQRDGWGHLYLYDGYTGLLERQLTSGPWLVDEVLYVDEVGRQLYFTAVGREAGRDPYYTHLYRVSLDGAAPGEPELLTPEDADHRITISPSGRYIVDTYSRVDCAPASVLRDANGKVVCALETADIEALLETGWHAPERFSAKARDGVTDVYGVIFRPSTFDSARSYPVIDSIYGGPQANQAPTSFAGSARGRGAGFWHAQALAELGFVVVMIDGLGMPYRAKAYSEVSFRNLADGGVPDHIATLRQLAERYPYLDLSRVGIYGHSGGGYASLRAILSHPDFYHVCVSSAGNHDHRLDKASWIERYMGLPVGDEYQAQANQTDAHRLMGKLLLIHGEMDENVHVASTLVVVDALIAADKDFDLLIMPNRTHACGNDPYFTRKRWDYFVRHLLGVEPPRYSIRGPGRA